MSIDKTIQPRPQGNKFIVPSGSLGFSVMVYTILSFVCIAILMFRRVSVSCGQAELGGPAGAKRLTAFTLISLWIVYIVVSSMQAYGFIKIDF